VIYQRRLQWLGIWCCWHQSVTLITLFSYSIHIAEFLIPLSFPKEPIFWLAWAIHSEEELSWAIYVGNSKSNLSCFSFMETTIDTMSTVTPFDRANTVFQLSTISYAFSPVMNKSLHAVLMKTYTSGHDPWFLLPLLKHTTHPSLCLHPLFGLHKWS